MHNGLSGENYDDYITQGVLRTGRGLPTVEWICNWLFFGGVLVASR